MRLPVLFLSSFILLSGCSTIPQSVSGDNYAILSPEQVRANPEMTKSTSVRWGGVIVEVINNERETWIEVLALPLNSISKPISDRQRSQGRFIAKTNSFLDPEIYQKGLKITFTGEVSSSIEGKIGERAYSYPVIDVTGHHLWPKLTYRGTRYVAPGYWYYGFHPHWRFGYPFYGYGVWHYNVTYPYYPVYGFLHQSFDRIPDNYAHGDFSFIVNQQRFNQDSFRWRYQSSLTGLVNNRGYSDRYRQHKPSQNRVTNRSTNRSRSSSSGRKHQSRPMSPRSNPIQSQK